MPATKKLIRPKPKRKALRIAIRLKVVDYNNDFFKWTQNQVRLLKRGAYNELDIENLIEEIESLGKSDRRALRSYLILVLQHMLKIEYSAKNHIYTYYLNSWISTVRDAQTAMDLILEDSPSLKQEISKYLPTAYQHAAQKAAQEMNMNKKNFPSECPWLAEQVLNRTENSS